MANGSLSGMSDQEAREFHRLFMVSFIVFTIIAIVAHVLVWQWRPWLPGPEGYGAVTEGINAVVTSAVSYFT